jgi:hypothetical protein
VTSDDVWSSFSDKIRETAKRALETNRVTTSTTPAGGGTVFISASFAGSLDQRSPEPPYLIEWIGPWDSLGRILLDRNLDRVFVDGRLRRQAA